jgi:hypothetical protein
LVPREHDLHARVRLDRGGGARRLQSSDIHRARTSRRVRAILEVDDLPVLSRRSKRNRTSIVPVPDDTHCRAE